MIVNHSKLTLYGISFHKVITINQFTGEAAKRMLVSHPMAGGIPLLSRFPIPQETTIEKNKNCENTIAAGLSQILVISQIISE